MCNGTGVCVSEREREREGGREKELQQEKVVKLSCF